MAGSDIGSQTDSTAAAADVLYGLPLGEFTAVWGERAKQARADGDREAAAAIGKLPKPSVVAWLANQLARQHPDEIRPLLEVGEALRQATAALDAGRLRELSRQQRDVVASLLDLARGLADAAGQAVSDSTARGLEDTLHAALADEEAARQLTLGELAAGLSRTGFPGMDSTAEFGRAAADGAVPVPEHAPAAEPSQRAGKKAPDRQARAAAAAKAAEQARQQQLERARRAEADARRDAGEASRDQDRAQAALAAAQRDARQAEETISRLQEELDAALESRNDAGRTQRQLQKDADRAGRAARQAGRRLTEATVRREDLDHGPAPKG
jgi:hypothetical protein